MEERIIEVEQEAIIPKNNSLSHFSGHNNDLRSSAFLMTKRVRPHSSGIILYSYIHDYVDTILKRHHSCLK